MNTIDVYKAQVRDSANALNYICNDHDDLAQKMEATDKWLDLAIGALTAAELYITCPTIPTDGQTNAVLQQIRIALAGV